MSLEVVKGNKYLIFDNKPEEPRNLGQKMLLRYLNKLFRKGEKVKEENLIRIYLNHVRKDMKAEVDFWGPKFESHEECLEAGYSSSDYYRHPFPHYKGVNFREWTKEDYTIITGTRYWVQRSIGSLVKNGYLMVVPTGYKLVKEIEDGRNRRD